MSWKSSYLHKLSLRNSTHLPPSQLCFIFLHLSLLCCWNVQQIFQAKLNWTSPSRIRKLFKKEERTREKKLELSSEWRRCLSVSKIFTASTNIRLLMKKFHFISCESCFCSTSRAKSGAKIGPDSGVCKSFKLDEKFYVIWARNALKTPPAGVCFLFLPSLFFNSSLPHNITDDFFPFPPHNFPQLAVAPKHWKCRDSYFYFPSWNLHSLQ